MVHQPSSSIHGHTLEPSTSFRSLSDVDESSSSEVSSIASDNDAERHNGPDKTAATTATTRTVPRRAPKRPLSTPPTRVYASVVGLSPVPTTWALPVATRIYSPLRSPSTKNHNNNNNNKSSKFHTHSIMSTTSTETHASLLEGKKDAALRTAKTEASSDDNSNDSDSHSSNDDTTVPCRTVPTTVSRMLFPSSTQTQPQQLVTLRKAPLTARRCTKLVQTLDGRDKFTKVLQYTCRLLAWWWQRGSSSSSSKRLNALKASLTNARKAFRLGRSIQEGQKLADLGLLEWIVAYGRQQQQQQKDNKRLGNGSAVPPLWNMAGQALKMLGLFGYWTCDNASFLAQAGVLDNHSLDDQRRLRARKDLVSTASRLANRSYFLSAVSSLLLNWKRYRDHLRKERDEENAASDGTATTNNDDETKQKMRLALLKNVCDVVVFSNNAGVDVWQRYRGYKMHEGLHCLLGLVSASSVLYTIYPGAAAAT